MPSRVARKNRDLPYKQLFVTHATSMGCLLPRYIPYSFTENLALSKHSFKHNPCDLTVENSLLFIQPWHEIWDTLSRRPRWTRGRVWGVVMRSQMRNSIRTNRNRHQQRLPPYRSRCVFAAFISDQENGLCLFPSTGSPS